MFTIQPPPSIIFEGDTGVFTVRLRQASTQPERVAVTVASGTATLGQDFLFSNSTQLLFAPGQVARTFSVRTFSDTQREIGGETFNIMASSLTQPTATAVTRVGRVFDLIPSTLRAEDAQVVEGNSGTVNAVFTVRLEGSPATPVSVNYATADVTATAGTDYTATSGVLTFAVGETVKTISVPVTGDVIAEQNETFRLNFSNPARGMTIATPFVTGTIINDEADAPGFQITVTYTDPSLPAAQRAVFQQAVNRLQQIITGDVPGVTLPSGEFIDDIRIRATVQTLAPTVNGFASATQFRPGVGGLPYEGEVTINALRIGDPGIYHTIIHEMIHAIGFYSSFFGQIGRVTGLGTTAPLFTGLNATREYGSVFGLPAATGVPLYGDLTAPGSYGSHWETSVIGTEIMSVGWDTTSAALRPFSRITVGALQDLGYTVDYAAADPYTPPPPPDLARLPVPPRWPAPTPVPPASSQPLPTPAPAPRPTPAPSPVPPAKPAPGKDAATSAMGAATPASSQSSIGATKPASPSAAIAPLAEKPVASGMRAAAFAALAPR